MFMMRRNSQTAINYADKTNHRCHMGVNGYVSWCCSAGLYSLVRFTLMMDEMTSLHRQHSPSSLWEVSRASWALRISWKAARAVRQKKVLDEG